jgi:predicted nucleic acid-binding Zn ribbon protein
LAQLRGYWEPEEVDGFEKEAADILSKALNGLQAGLAERVAEEEVLAAWHDVVGDFVAQHSQPTKLDRRTLYVQVLQPAIHYTLERQKADILNRMQARFGKQTIRQLRFRIG